MRYVISLAVLALAGCAQHRDERRDERSSGPAYEAGRAAHAIARESAKGARVLGREIKQGAQQAHEGWRDASQEQKRKDRAKGER